MVNEASVGVVLRIMPVGDSITAGYTNATTWTIPFTFGYRGPLYTKLTDAGYDFQFVGTSGEPWNYPFGAAFGIPTVIQGPDLRTVGQDNHRGYGGATTSQILNGGVVGGSTNPFPGIVGMLNADNPDIVLLMIGTNGIADAMGNIDTLVNTIVTTKPIPTDCRPDPTPSHRRHRSDGSDRAIQQLHQKHGGSQVPGIGQACDDRRPVFQFFNHRRGN